MMFIRSTLLIVLLGILIFNSIVAQETTAEQTTAEETTEEPTTTTPITTTPITTTISERTTACNYPDEFPLFDDNTCISRTAYTTIFLISIILAGLSFLMLIGLMILYCCRHTDMCGSYDESDIESSGSHRSVEKSSSVGNPPSMNGGRGQFSNAVRNIPGTTPIEVSKNQSSPPAAPYSPVSPVPKVVPRTKPKVHEGNGKTNASESYELTTRETNPPRTHPSTSPKTTNLDDRPVRNRPIQPTLSDETETSYF